MVSFISVWGLVMVSLCYTFFVDKLVRKRIWRHILIIPVMLIFFTVPLLNSSIHFIGITSFFIAWLANFKIFLFASRRGPLYSNPKPLSLPIFLAVSCLPIKIQLNPKSNTYHLDGRSRDNPILGYTIKLARLVLIKKVFGHSDILHEKAVLILNAINIYFVLDFILAATSAMVRAISCLELEPQVDKPYLATSLQNFWGRRWNLMVTGILRPTVYEPMIELFSFLGRNKSRYPAVFITFFVSGLMHELIFFYIGRVKSNWKVMWFFLIHGLCTAIEIAIKKTVNQNWRLPTSISRISTIGFVTVTSLCLFLPEFKRANVSERTFEDKIIQKGDLPEVDITKTITRTIIIAEFFIFFLLFDD
ncbi:unnamed protein product [Cochlearia groenlandica]